MDENRQGNQPTPKSDKNPPAAMLPASAAHARGRDENLRDTSRDRLSKEANPLAAQREADRCLDVLAKAKVHYAEPLSDLKLTKPIEQLYRDSGSSLPIGTWMKDVPKPGDVASCIKPKTERTR
jgi:hypothetical protein